MDYEKLSEKIKKGFADGTFMSYFEEMERKNQIHRNRFTRILDLDSDTYNRLMDKVVANPQSNLANLYISAAKSFGEILVGDERDLYPSTLAYGLRSYFFQEWYGPMTIPTVIQKMNK